MSSRELLLVVILSVSATGCGRKQLKPAEPPPDEVLVSLPSSDVVTDFEDFIGHTEAVYSVEVRARVNGYLDQVNFKDGEDVEKGTVLFQIDARPYKATFDNTMSMVEQSQARFARTTADHRRAEALLARNAIGREEYDRIQGDYAESKATIGAVQATLEMAQLNLDWTKVTAPISGRSSRRMIDPGNLIQADVTPLTTIVSLDPIYVYFDIDERTLLKIRRLIAEGRVKSRREAELPVMIGLSDETDYPHQGIIDFSDNRIDASTGTLWLRASVANPKPRLFSPGLFVRVRFPIGEPHRSVLIAEQAIGTDQGRKYVYVVEQGKIKDKKTGAERTADIVKYRPIEVGTLIKGMRVVDKGLAEGERVVIGGLQRVRPNKEVTPRLQADFDRSLAAKKLAPATREATPPATATAAAATPSAVSTARATDSSPDKPAAH